MIILRSAAVAALTLFTILTQAILLHGGDINELSTDTFDYVVVGCGISGLVVTNRLSENPTRTVLCIEAGQADHYESIVQYPVYVGADIGGIYDWKLATTPQTQLDGHTRPMPQGKALGGGSILNAMCWNRGGADDYDAWEALGNPGWDWEGILPYFRKSETYTPVYTEEVAREYSINYNPAVHGSTGPVQVSYPKYFYPQSGTGEIDRLRFGLPTQFDPNDGTSAGPAFVPTDLDPNNQTRSDARRTYFDPYVNRSNFHVITGQHVTRIVIEGIANNSQVSNPTPGGNDSGDGTSSGNNDGFGFGPGGSTPPIANQTSNKVRRQDPASSDLRITGVEFAPNASAVRQTVYATREVIVAAGALHSAQLLQLSGIGPASLLNQFDIPLALDLPGVGNNLQDHCLVGTFYPYNNASYPSPTELTNNATYNIEAEQEYETEKTGPWTAGSPNALAFNPLSLITNNSGVIIANASLQSADDYLVPDLHPTVVAGYAAQKRSLVSRMGRDNVAAYEIINNNAGSLTVSVMHPFSRGTCYITSADPYQPPAINPRWLTNPVDRQVLVEALRFNELILETPPMQELQPAQFVPPAHASEDALNQIINNGIRTEFHPSGTLAMLPLEQGGVVNPHLRVYGTQNLRVVDAGIFPLLPAAHLQAVVYGVAEKAADIIKADNLQSSAISPAPSPEGATSLSVDASTSSTLVSIAASSSSSSSGQDLSSSAADAPGLAEMVPTSLSSPSESVLLFTTTLPVDLPAQLSSIRLNRPTPIIEFEATTTDTPEPTLSGAAQLRQSVARVLTSVGLPPSVVTSLKPAIIGSPAESGAVASPSATEMEQQQQRAAIDAVLQWIISFFHLG
ncbi:MAG: hypothetical protein Q9217_004358 [Psora testacea]